MADTESAGVLRAFFRLAAKNPIAAVGIAIVSAFTFILWKVPESSQFFLTMLDQEHRQVLALVVVLAMVQIANTARANRLEQNCEAFEASTDLCRREQSVMRTAIFRIALAVAHSDDQRKTVTAIVKDLDAEIKRVEVEAQQTFRFRNGGPRNGGRRHDDPGARR